MNSLDVALRDLEAKLGREINYVVYMAREFRAKKKNKYGFLMEVLGGDKILLVLFWGRPLVTQF